MIKIVSKIIIDDEVRADTTAKWYQIIGENNENEFIIKIFEE